MQKPKKGLGKGLNALISSSVSLEKTKDTSGVLEIDINKIEPNKNQPRKIFDEDLLIELAESIKNFGVIQPLLLKDEGEYYSIIAGERRWRAGRIAKLATVPGIIKEYNQVETIQISLIENIQREDLNAIEEALCYKQLSEEFFFSQEDIANKIGKKRTMISAYLNLLNLDKRVQGFLIESKLTTGHGKVLLSIDDLDEQYVFAGQIIEKNLTVKNSETLINNYLISKNSSSKKEDSKEKSTTKEENLSTYNFIETELKNILGTKVNIKNRKNKGTIEIEYYSPEELDRIIGIFKTL